MGTVTVTDVLGLSMTASSTDTTSTAGFTIQKWQASCGFTVLEAHTQAGGGHTTPSNITDAEAQPGADATVVISYRLWQRGSPEGA